jgi:hypothetical protein
MNDEHRIMINYIYMYIHTYILYEQCAPYVLPAGVHEVLAAHKWDKPRTPLAEVRASYARTASAAYQPQATFKNPAASLLCLCVYLVLRLWL